ncbi:MAG TPA: hypothetical protein VLB76_09155 [Thermoanaerobaculia bacterium]|jgi:hypothetical protein|nr:hypothetical protein [Thermoanaerobaculia bacterium]
MPNKLEALWNFYTEHANQARQHEDQRERMTALLVALAGIIVGFLTQDKIGREFRLLASGVLIVLGIFGWLFSLKHYERNRYHSAILGSIRDEVDDEIANPGRVGALNLMAVRARGEGMHYQNYPEGPRLVQTQANNWIAKHRTYFYWSTVPLLVAVIGATSLALSILS